MSSQSKPPAEEGFWKRFSPNHELPLSTASSVVLHMVFVLLVALFASAVLDREARVPREPGEWVQRPLLVPGGGGLEDGNTFQLFAPDTLKEADPLEQPDPKKAADAAVPDVQSVSAAKPKPSRLQSILDTVKTTAATRPKGEDSTGTGGGAGGGDGRDIGPGKSPPKEPEEPLENRMERWTLRFEYSNGGDYLFQLRALGAMIAVPHEGDAFRLYRDLKQVSPRFEVITPAELRKLNRVYWANEDPQAAKMLAFAMGIGGMRDGFVAIFPQELQDDLAKKELAAAGGKPVKEIQETIFKVTRRGKSCEVRVIGQRFRR